MFSVRHQSLIWSPCRCWRRQMESSNRSSFFQSSICLSSTGKDTKVIPDPEGRCTTQYSTSAVLGEVHRPGGLGISNPLLYQEGPHKSCSVGWIGHNLLQLSVSFSSWLACVYHQSTVNQRNLPIENKVLCGGDVHQVCSLKNSSQKRELVFL